MSMILAIMISICDEQMNNINVNDWFERVLTKASEFVYYIEGKISILSIA